MLQRHAGAARASIARYYPGRDLNEVFDGAMTPDECWDLIRHLPSDSPLMAALADDEEYAADEEPGDPPWTEHGPEVRVLADIYDMLGTLVRQVAGLAGEPPRIRPYPRPGDARRAALDAAAREHDRPLWDRLFDQLGVIH